MNMERIKLSVLAILILSGLSSCRKQAASDDAIVDVFVKSVSLSGHPYFGLTHLVSGTDAMKSVTVLTPDAVTDSLTAYDASNLYYDLFPTFDVGGYTPNLPTSGVYTYKIKFNDGIEKTFTNTLSSSYLLPAANLSLAKTLDGNSVSVTWSPVTGAQAYQLIVTKGGITVFSSAFINPSLNTNTNLPISNLSAYAPGTFTFELDAVSFESSDFKLVQAVSASTADIDL